MIIECTLVIVGEIRFGRILIKHFGKPEHIVGIASLRSLNIVQHGREVIRRMEVLAYTISTDTDRTVIDYRVPEKTGGMIPLCSMIPVLVVL